MKKIKLLALLLALALCLAACNTQTANPTTISTTPTTQATTEATTAPTEPARPSMVESTNPIKNIILIIGDGMGILPYSIGNSGNSCCHILGIRLLPEKGLRRWKNERTEY